MAISILFGIKAGVLLRAMGVPGFDWEKLAEVVSKFIREERDKVAYSFA